MESQLFFNFYNVIINKRINWGYLISSQKTESHKKKHRFICSLKFCKYVCIYSLLNTNNNMNNTDWKEKNNNK